MAVVTRSTDRPESPARKARAAAADPVAAADPALAALLGAEDRRRRTQLHLLAGENLSSPAVRAVLGSALADKYAEGYPGHRGRRAVR